MKATFLVPYPPGESPGQRFRFEQWLRLLPAGALDADILPLFSHRAYRRLYETGGASRKAAQTIFGGLRRAVDVLAVRSDVVFVYRELFPLGGPILERLLAKRNRFVFDFDDAIWLGDTSAANTAVARFKRPDKIADIVAMATRTTVGNGFLRDYALSFSDRVDVVPTTLDTDAYVPPPARTRGDRVRIGWSGSPSTGQHLKDIEPALRRILRDLPVELVVMGDPTFRLPGASNVTVLPWTRDSERDVVGSFDIGLMPLPEDEWSRGKCGFKALLYMSLGVPAVVSPVGANCEIVHDGENGLHARTDTEWFDSIATLVDDERLALRLGRAGRETVVERYSGQRWAPRFLEILESAAQSR